MSAPDRDKVLPAGVLLALVALSGTGMMALANWHSRPHIVENERRHLLQTLQSVVPRGGYDNEPAEDRVEIDAPAWLGGQGPSTVYRARKAGQPAAAIFTLEAPDGYSGPIKMLVGIDTAGAVTGVRVVAHKETPGLGDGIEAERSDWIRGFETRSRSNTPDERWKVRRDGGDFDQLTGATITPRAVVKAVHRCVQFFDEQRERVFPEPSQG